MQIIITPATNSEMYVVQYTFYDEELGSIDTTDIVSPEDLGTYLHERIPYKVKTDLFKVVKK